ncbi:hypothetical protein CYLTODRAFT_419557 [Cylindrobasidium torrendii FP15055 ss-10]|uniref:Uncharacterized protein n=1 Tax=Cylindrobasidium torrendii FP15055 ss-10 TaxID=1314674 RepID=A0A0D7BKU1_9AGAR|nr:hypothetical protein CYLTODRAFT_419557 [Cylindrobasidium torrendii FP15055 ss-10]
MAAATLLHVLPTDVLGEREIAIRDVQTSVFVCVSLHDCFSDSPAPRFDLLARPKRSGAAEKQKTNDSSRRAKRETASRQEENPFEPRRSMAESEKRGSPIWGISLPPHASSERTWPEREINSHYARCRRRKMREG